MLGLVGGGVADLDDEAQGALGPAGFLQRRLHAGIDFLGIVVGADVGGAHVGLDQLGEGDAVDQRRREGLAHELQLGRHLQVVAVADEAEPHLVLHRRIGGDGLRHVEDRLLGQLHVLAHGAGEVHDEHDVDAHVAGFGQGGRGAALALVVGVGERGVVGAVGPFGRHGGGDLQQPRVFLEQVDLLESQHRQDVEGVLDVGELLRLDGDHRLRLLAGVDLGVKGGGAGLAVAGLHHLPQGVGGVEHQDRVARLVAGAGVGVGDHQGLPPLHHVLGLHPAFRLVRRAADLIPALRLRRIGQVEILAVEHEQGREGGHVLKQDRFGDGGFALVDVRRRARQSPQGKQGLRLAAGAGAGAGDLPLRRRRSSGGGSEAGAGHQAGGDERTGGHAPPQGGCETRRHDYPSD
ncbi:hypothetical protein GCM10009099_39530 [Caenispirillum bisanense]